MAFDPALADAISRMRYAVGDTAATPLEPDTTYQAIFDTHGEQLGIAVIAEALATRYARKPTSVSIDGDSFTWNDRVRTWLATAKRVRDETGTASGLAGAFVATREGDDAAEYVRSAQTIGHGWWTD